MGRRRVASVMGTCVLLAGGIGASVLLGAGPVQAVACGGAIAAGSTCTDTGTLTFTAGTLTLTSPSALGWTGTANGLDQNLVDTTVAHQTYVVDDATGSGAGWHVTVSATNFTNGTVFLPLSSFSTTGSITNFAATTAPTAACTTGATCTLPTNTTTYPVTITTAASAPTAFTVYDTSAATGLGSINIGAPGALPVGWWLNVPANTKTGTAYTSTITLGVISGP
jgi:hypothetical protein